MDTTDSITSSTLSSDSNKASGSVQRLTIDDCLSDRRPIRFEGEHEEQNKSKCTGVQDEKNIFCKIKTIVSIDDNRNDEDEGENEYDDEKKNNNSSINEINIEHGKIMDENNDCNDLLDFDPSLFSNISKGASNNTNQDINENLNNPKFNQKKKTKDEKQAEHRLKSKQKRTEYANRVKIRNCESWDMLTEEEQNTQKNNRKEKIKLSEKVRFLFFSFEEFLLKILE
jgi:hypothetical protein